MLDRAEAYALDVDGYVVVKQAFDAALIAGLRAALERAEAAVANGSAAFPVSWTPVVNEVRVLDLLDGDPAFVGMIDHPAILARVQALVPEPQRLVEAFSITRGKGVGLPLHAIETARYHVENGEPRCDMLTAMVCLSDCGPEDGPFVVFAGTHKLGVPFPYARVHPASTVPSHDRAVSAAAIADGTRGLLDVPWEQVPGYREVTAQAGDLVLFVQSLWHGAKDLHSGKVRRTLYFSYGPYHVCNWHGVPWSAAARERASPTGRRLLGGPFIGQRYPAVPVGGVPDDMFAPLPDSELGPRRILPVAPREPDWPGDRAAALQFIADCLVRTQRRPGARGDRTITATGRCVLDLGGDAAEALEVEVGDDGVPRAARRTDATPDCVVRIAAQDLAAVLQQRVDAQRLWADGRAQVRGNVALAMQIVSSLSQ